MCWCTDAMVEFEAASYVVTEGDGPLSVCLTKDKTTAVPVLLSVTAQESIPPSATGSYIIMCDLPAILSIS